MKRNCLSNVEEGLLISMNFLQFNITLTSRCKIIHLLTFVKVDMKCYGTVNFILTNRKIIKLVQLDRATFLDILMSLPKNHVMLLHVAWFVRSFPENHVV